MRKFRKLKDQRRRSLKRKKLLRPKRKSKRPHACSLSFSRV